MVEDIQANTNIDVGQIVSTQCEMLMEIWDRENTGQF